MHPPIEQQITFLYTRDLPGTVTFYEDVLGLAVALDQGSCVIFHVVGDCYVGFCERGDAPATPVPPDRVVFTIVTEKVDLWHQVLSNKGVPFESLPKLKPEFNIYHCTFRDPNGYLIEIQKFLGPDWPG